jgi:opacity protein-like surface antigen
MARFPLSASGGLRVAGLLGMLVAGSVSATAADLGAPAPLEEAPKPALVEIGSGWYLRGDAGYVIYSDPKANEIGLSTTPFNSERIQGAFVGGGGVGYKFTNWFRSDLTLDYRAPTNFSGTNSLTNFIEDFSTDSAKFTATTLLLNGYADLGTWYGVTPYVGAGVGVAQTRLESFKGSIFLLPASPLYPVGSTGPLLVSTTLPDSSSKYNFAWALMAGASIDIDQYLKIDAGYRYVRLDEADTKLDVLGVGTRVKEIQAHEFRVGLRYMIDGE